MFLCVCSCMYVRTYADVGSFAKSSSIHMYHVCMYACMKVLLGASLTVAVVVLLRAAYWRWAAAAAWCNTTALVFVIHTYRFTFYVICCCLWIIQNKTTNICICNSFRYAYIQYNTYTFYRCIHINIDTYMLIHLHPYTNMHIYLYVYI